MNKKILFGFWLFINFAGATVPASVDHTNLSLGQSLSLTIDVSNSSNDPDLNVLKNNFDIFGTSSSSQTTIVNGRISSQKNFIVNLTPKNLGKQTIPAIKVGSDATAPIAIDVVEASSGNAALAKSQIFIKAKILNPVSYVGVPLIYSIKLYFSIGLANVNLANIDISGATIKPLGKSIQYSEDVAGNNYQVLEQKFQITPNQAGNITIPAVKISGASIENNANSFLSMTQPKPFNIASKPINIFAKPIPPGINPSKWFPAKQVTIRESQSVTATTLKLGQPITRTIVVQALGVTDTSIPEINLAIPNNVNAYPDKTVSSTSFSNDDMLATKMFKTAYIPTKAGLVEFPETSIKWWDITSNSSKTALIPAKTYIILNENGKTVIASSTPVPAQTSTASTPIKQTSQPQIANGRNMWLYIAIIVTLLWLMTLLIGIILFRRKSTLTLARSPVKDEPVSEIKSHNLVNSACQNKDITALNSALIKWATLHWHKPVYTVLDIKDLSTNPRLNELIDKLDQTIYRDGSFTQFEELAHEIDVLGQINKQTDRGLKELYPK